MIWLLDEPATALDEQAFVCWRTDRSKLAADGLVITATHQDLGLGHTAVTARPRSNMSDRAHEINHLGAAPRPRHAARSRAEVLLILVFFMLIASLFPLATSPQTGLLKQIGPGIAWVSALLAICCHCRACSPPIMPTARSNRC